MSAARTEMETNYFGTLAMVLGRSPRCWPRPAAAPCSTCCRWRVGLASPFNGSYCASKSAEWALTNALNGAETDYQLLTGAPSSIGAPF